MEKIYFCVIESKQNYRPANSEKNVDFDSLSMLLLIHQPLLKVALKMKTFSFNTMMKFTQQEPLQHFFRI